MADLRGDEKSVKLHLDRELHRRFKISSSFRDKSMTRQARELVERFVSETEAEMDRVSRFRRSEK